MKRSLSLSIRAGLHLGVFAALLFLSPPAPGQSAPAQRMATLTVSAADLQLGTPIFAVVDSGGHALAVAAVAREDGQTLWTRQTREPSTVPGTVHWHFDEENGMLVLDFGAVDPAAVGSGLTVTVLPLNTRAERFQMAVYRQTGPSEREFLKTVRIDAP